MNEIDPNLVKKMLDDNKYLARALLNFQKEIMPPYAKVNMTANLNYPSRNPNFSGVNSNMQYINNHNNNSNNNSMMGNNAPAMHGIENRRDYDSRPHGWPGNFVKK